MKTHHRAPSPLPSAVTPSADEAGRRSSQEIPSRVRHRSHRRPSELAAASYDTPQPAVDSRAGTARARRVHDSLDGRRRGPTLETRANRGSSRRPFAHRGDRVQDAGDDGSSSSGSGTASEGSGTLWVRVMPTDENSSEEDLKPPPSLESTTAPWRGREELLRRYLGGRDGGESETPSCSRSHKRTAQAQRGARTEKANSSGAAHGIDAAGAAAGSRGSPSPDSSGSEALAAPDEAGPDGRLRDGADDNRPRIKRENRLRRMFVTELAAVESSTSEGGVIDRSRAAGGRPCLLDRTEGDGLEKTWVEDGEEGAKRVESGNASGRRGLSIAAARNKN